MTFFTVNKATVLNALRTIGKPASSLTLQAHTNANAQDLGNVLREMQGTEIRAIKMERGYAWWPLHDPLPGAASPPAARLQPTTTNDTATPQTARLIPLLSGHDDPEDIAAQPDATTQKVPMKTEPPTAAAPAHEFSERQTLAFATILKAMQSYPGPHSTNDVSTFSKFANIPGWLRLLRKEGFVSVNGARRKMRWAITDAGVEYYKQNQHAATNPKQGATLQAKAPEKERLTKTFERDLAAQKNEPTHQICTAITDDGNLMLFDGPPDTTAPTIIPPYMARRLVALLRTLPTDHALSL